MSQDGTIHFRLDRGTELRLKEIANAQGLSLSALCRKLVYEAASMAPAGSASGWAGPQATYDEVRQRALDALAEKIRRFTPVDPLRWVRASIEEIPPLRNMDAERVLFEVQRRAGVALPNSSGEDPVRVAAAEFPDLLGEAPP
ncbi:MAG TPA: hypothetical protein VGV89_09305 [Thermoplasmata archaeon]|nr:hypothetical protein [Thermoplasmata archaeon]